MKPPAREQPEDRGHGLRLVIWFLLCLLALVPTGEVSASGSPWAWLRPSAWPVFVDVTGASGHPDWTNLPEATGRHIVVWCTGCTFDSEDWERLGRVDAAAITLALPGGNVQDWGRLRGLDGRLQHLWLRDVPVDFDALDAIGSVHSLRSLALTNAGLRSVHLPRLSSLRNLTVLGLAENPIRQPERREWTDKYVEYPQGSGRLRFARGQKLNEVEALFKDAGVDFPPERLLFRVFKAELELEVWAADEARGPMTHLATYTICDAPPYEGPKTEEGDNIVPEGFYRIDMLKEMSDFFLAMRIGYPNRLDKRLRRTGSAIMIHGACCSVGCLAMSDERIMELYLMAKRVRAAGGLIPVHLYPRRDLAGAIWRARERGDEALATFWENIKKGNDVFEATGKPPAIDDGGPEYEFPDWTPDLATAPRRLDQGVEVLRAFPSLRLVELRGTPVASHVVENAGHWLPGVWTLVE